MVIYHLYTEQWKFIRQYEGLSKNDAIAKMVADDVKGHAVCQDDKSHIHFK